jgi:hypothetical protein
MNIILSAASPKYTAISYVLPVSIAAFGLFSLVSSLVSCISFDLYLTLHALTTMISLPLSLLIYRKVRCRNHQCHSLNSLSIEYRQKQLRT